MRVLHYALGLPPIRTGGLVEYSLSLMERQSQLGVEVSLLYPAGFSLLSPDTHIRYANSFKKTGIETYRLVNSLPLPLFGGVKKPADFMKPENEAILIKNLKEIRPDLIHIHTLMGLPLEFFLAAKKLEIPLVYTTHDYYGLFPTPTFYYRHQNFEEMNDARAWACVSQTALATWNLRIAQSGVYPIVRRGMHMIGKSRSNTAVSENDGTAAISADNIAGFNALKNYYRHEFNNVDYFLFNSSITQSVFRQQLGQGIAGQVLTISNDRIPVAELPKPRRLKKTIAFLGQNTEEKGFLDFVRLSEFLSKENYIFCTYGYQPTQNYEHITQYGRYNGKQISDLLQMIDLVVVPSKWYETFSLIAAESISSGTSTIVSKTVGAKDLLPKSRVFSSFSELLEKVRSPETFNRINLSVPTMSEHVASLSNVYDRIILGAYKRIEKPRLHGSYAVTADKNSLCDH